MNKTTIHHVIGIEGSTLIVFYTEAHCWQFRLISNGEAVFGERKLYRALKLLSRQGWTDYRGVRKLVAQVPRTLTLTLRRF